MRTRRKRPVDSVHGLFETHRPGGLHERVHRSLAHAISSGKFMMGMRLPSEPELALAFGVSRPVVRQALDLLRRQGLIASQRGSGNYVSSANPEQSPALSDALTVAEVQRALDDLEFRLVTEPEAAFRAAVRRTPADLDRMAVALQQLEDAHTAGALTHYYDFLFHEAIATATANECFVEAVRALEYRPDDARLHTRHQVHFLPHQRGLAVVREHGAVLAFIRDRDGENARKAMWEHIEAARQRVEQRVNAFAIPPGTDLA